MAFDMENLASCRMEFRQETSYPEGDCDGDFNYDENLDQPFGFTPSIRNSMGKPFTLVRAQVLGEVEVRSGRLITFPNVMEHRWRPMRLSNPACKGHVRFVSICLVDPHYRLCSTRNVPIQQPEVWSEQVTVILQQRGLPAELCAWIIQDCVSLQVEQAHDDHRRLREELDLVKCLRYDYMR